MATEPADRRAARPARHARRAPSRADVRRYLREFLSDPRVIDLPAPLRALLLARRDPARAPARTRPRPTAKIWTRPGSPLLVHSEALRARRSRRALGASCAVALGMRYGAAAHRRRAAPRSRERGVRAAGRVAALPAVLDGGDRLGARARLRSGLRRAASSACIALGPFYDDAGLRARLARRRARRRSQASAPDHVLFCYHGLPERQIRAADPTGATASRRADCCDALGAAQPPLLPRAVLRDHAALGAALGAAPRPHSTAFQSRLGRTPWIEPYTDVELPGCARRGRAARSRCCARRSSPTASRRSRRSASARARSGARSAARSCCWCRA